MLCYVSGLALECVPAVLNSEFVCVLSTEEVSISISVSNCQIQENVVRGHNKHRCRAVCKQAVQNIPICGFEDSLNI